jgi:hypothetical protein
MMLKLSTKILALAVVAVLASLTLWAEVKVELTASKVVRAGDKEMLQSADRAKLGDVIEYKAVFRNTDTQNPATKVKGVIPVHEGMEYLPGTAQPKEIEASADGKTFAPVPLKRQVKTADGTTVEQLIPYSEYKILRWNLGEIAGGASKTVSARMKVKSGN